MIQRIQSLYLFICSILNLAYCYQLYFGYGFAMFFLDIESNFPFEVILLFPLIISVISFYTIFKYKNRKTQFVLNRLSIILCFVFVGILIFMFDKIYSFEWINLVPLFSIVLLVLANRAIKKDEDLIRSIDRIR